MGAEKEPTQLVITTAMMNAARDAFYDHDLEDGAAPALEAAFRAMIAAGNLRVVKLAHDPINDVSEATER